jgi:hypothetical protein
MIRITITAEAYAAIEGHDAGRLGRRGAADRRQGRAPHLIDPHVANKLKLLRGPGESFTDVIPAAGAGRPDWPRIDDAARRLAHSV